LKSFLLNNPEALNQNPIVKMSAQKLNQFELNLFAEVDAFCVEVGINQEAYIKEKGLRDLVGKMKRHQEAKKQLFHCDGCGCDVSKSVFQECESNRNGENHICPDCYDGEYEKECAHCDCLCSDEYSGDVEGDADACICEDCFNNMEKCEMCGDPTDAEEWTDLSKNILYCSHCYNKHQERIAKYEAIVKSSSSPEEALAKWTDILNFKPDSESEKQLAEAVAKSRGIAEEIEVLKQMRAEVEEPKPFQMFQNILAEAVAKQEAEPEPDEEFEADVINSHLLEVFGGEVVYNKVKELAKYPDLSSTLRVVWKFGKEYLSLYVYIDGEPFFDEVYPCNHSCDMFYMLEELKKEQECDNEVAGVCWECGVEGKFIGKEGDDWRCLDCSSM
jgi:hypothetical protein